MEPDDLYGLPLEQFTTARNALAKQRPEVKGLRKPNAAAYAVNQLARRHAAELDSFLAAAAQLRNAQVQSGDFRVALHEERRALERLVQLAGEYAGAPQLPRVRQTLQAAAADESAAAAVRAGQLERELEPAGFGSLVGGAAPARRKRAAAKPAVDRAAVERARVAEREAKAALREAERAETAAEAELERARAAVAEAKRRVAEATQRLKQARRGG
jgi:hypothetical protein